MKFFTFISLFLAFSYSSVGQEAINQFDANGKRHGVWKKKYEGTEQLRYQGTFSHGKEVGVFKFYCEACKEQPSVIKEFSKNSSVATVTFYTIKGNIVSQGKMDGKKRIGEWLTYHKDSKVVMTREFYDNDILNGKKTVYFPNGKPTEEITYVNGLRQGQNIFYSQDGVPLKKLNYKDDKLHGPAQYFDAYGNLTIAGTYKNGKKDGLWKYYKNGKIAIQETYPKPVKKDK